MQQPITAAYPHSEEPTGVVAIVAALPWLTVERAAYGGLALLALALRLVALSAYPLSDAEAGQALVAWHIHNGQPVAQAGYSPLLVTLNLVTFLLLGGSEFAARLGSALLGVALVLLPCRLRRHLGRTGALAAAALFTISPTALYLSRIANGDIGAAVGGLALVVGLFGWLDTQISNHKSQIANPESETSNLQPPTSNLQFPTSHLYPAGVGLILMLTASPSAYSTLALLVGFLALAAVVGGSGYAAPAREGLSALRTRFTRWGDLGLILVIGLLAVASGLLFNLGGLAATADLLTSWFVGFAPLMVAGGAYPAIFLLSLYEPLILLAGLFGLSVVLLRRRLIDLFLGWWFFGGIALDLLRSGRTAGEMLVPLVPLTLLGGLALGMLWDSFCAPRRQGNEGRRQGVAIVAAIGLVLGGFAYVELMSYTRMGGWTFLLPVAALGLFIGFVALFWIWEEGSSAWQGAALAAVIVLLGCTVATASRLNYGRLADPRQPLVRAPMADGLPNLVTTLKQVSSWRAGDPYLLDIIADRRLGQAVEWQLRRFDNVTWVDTVSQLSQSVSAGHPTAVLAPATESGQGDGLLPLDAGYLGQGFAIRAFWTPAGLSGQSLVRWIILRSADTPVNFDRAVLWVKQE